MAANFEIEQDLIAQENEARKKWLAEDFEYLGRRLLRLGIDIETVVEKAQSFKVAIPSWGVGTGGTRFARFPGAGEPRNIYEKLEDCRAIYKLVRSTSAVSLHIPWDKPENAADLFETAQRYGLTFDAMNSNTFQDQPGQARSYKFGSLTHTDPVVRKQAIEHNLGCIQIGRKLGSKALTVWIGDGSNFAGQSNFRHAL